MSTKLRVSKLVRGGAADMDLTADDNRAEQAGAVIATTDSGRQVVAEMFGDLDASKQAEIVKARGEILEDWGRLRHAALQVGRSLLHLSRILSEDEFRRVRRGSERLFPFSDSVATQLRMAAQLAETWSIPADQAPPYTILYDISRLSEAGQELVRARGLIRPDVRRIEIAAIRSEVKAGKMAGTAAAAPLAPDPAADTRITTIDVERLRDELVRVDARLAELANEIQRLTGRRLELVRLLGVETVPDTE